MKFAKYWLPPIVVVVAIFVVSNIPYLELGLRSPFEEIARNTGHSLAYLLLFILFARAFDGGQRLYTPPFLLRAATLTTLFALFDEVHQAFVPGREGSGVDILIDGIGIFVGTLYFRIRYKW